MLYLFVAKSEKMSRTKYATILSYYHTYTIIRDSKRKMIQIEALRANSKYFRATSLVPALKCQWQLCLNEQSKHGFHLDPVDPNEDI